jgi:uncharacterized repeat protein (TIGR01451 family)
VDPNAADNSSSFVTTILAPDLTLSKSHVGNFTVGVNGTYTLTASNAAGTAATSGAIAITDTLPTGLGFVSGTGVGWACSAVGQVVTCTSVTPIAAGATGNPIALVVSVSAPAVPSVTNIASVSGGGEPAGASGNNVASDNTLVANAAVNTFAPDNAQTALPGTSVFYAHTFTAGLAGSVGFSTSNVATPAVAGWVQAIFRDTNCNGVLDGTEGAAPLAGTIPMVPGDQVCIIVRDTVPAAAPFNAQNAITVTATFSGGLAYTRSDVTTVGATGAGLTLGKTVRNLTLGTAAGTTNTARPNDLLEYTVTYSNGANAPIGAIVVNDATPAFTTFQSASCGAPLPASLTGCSATTQPAVGGTGAIAWTLAGSLAPGNSGTVVFVVRVNP